MRPFPWTLRSDRAAVLVADDRLTDRAIAEEVGIAKGTLERWKAHEEFAGRVREVVEQLRQAAMSEGIGSKAERVRGLNDRRDRLRRVIVERAEAMKNLEEVPGAGTGLLAKSVKGIGSNDNFQVVEEYRTDTGLLAELRATEEQAARELGQWTEKQEITGKDGAEIVVKVIRGVSMDDL